MGIRCADHVTPLYPQTLALTSPTGGGRSVGIVRSRTKATEFFFNAMLVPFVGLCQVVVYALFVLYAFFVICAYMLHATYALTHPTFYMKSMFAAHFVLCATCLLYAHSLLWFYMIYLHVYLLQKLIPSSEAHCFPHLLVVFILVRR